MTAVKVGALGRLPKEDLKPKIFFHPEHKNAAEERQIIEATQEMGRRAKAIAQVLLAMKFTLITINN